MSYAKKQHHLWTPYKSSGVKTVDTAITTTPGEVLGILITADGTNDPTIEMKNGGASSTVLLDIVVDTSETKDNTMFYYFGDPGVLFDSTIYLEITLGAGTVEVTVLYRS